MAGRRPCSKETKISVLGRATEHRLKMNEGWIERCTYPAHQNKEDMLWGERARIRQGARCGGRAGEAEDKSRSDERQRQRKRRGDESRGRGRDSWLVGNRGGGKEEEEEEGEEEEEEERKPRVRMERTKDGKDKRDGAIFKARTRK